MSAAESFESTSSQPHRLEEALARAANESLRTNLGRWVRFAGHQSGDVLELQAINVRSGRWESSYAAHARTFTEALALAEAAAVFDCDGLYAIANQPDPEIAYRYGTGKWNQIGKGKGTSDAEIARRVVFYCDIDWSRAKGISCTDKELQTLSDVAVVVHDEVASILGDETPVAYAASGNGRAIFVALDYLPNDEHVSKLVAGGLAALRSRFEAGRVKIDTSVGDAKRLVPLFGSVKRKGISVPGRPHRRAVIVAPPQLRRVGLEEFEMFVERLRESCDEHGRAEVDKALGRRVRTAPSSGVSASAQPRASGQTPFDRAKAVPIRDVLAWQGLLEGDDPRCPGCSISDGSSVVVVGNGLKCSHARCASKGYARGFRTTVDVVCERSGVSATEAVKLMAKHFGFEGFTSAANDTDRTAPEAPTDRTGLSPADIIARWRAHGPIERLPTGWETFDADSRGGLILGHCTYLLGAPNAKKTAALGCLANHWSRSGVAVGALLVDETPDDFLIRLAVMAGYTLEDCEQRMPDVLQGIENLLTGLPLRLYGSDWTIETAAEDFASFARVQGSGRTVFMVDTVQTVSSAGALRADNPRALVSANVKALQAVATDHRWAVLVTSEMNRNAYRSEDAAERSNDMAAGKESGAIEYAAKAQLVFRTVKGNADVVRVCAPKIKRGSKDEAEFFLRFDRAAHSLIECQAPDDSAARADREERGRARTMKQVRDDANLLFGIVLRSRGIGSVELRAELKRQGHGWGVERLEAAKRELGPRLENRGRHPRDVRWHAVPTAEGRP